MKKAYCNKQVCSGFVGTISLWLLVIFLQVFLFIYLSRQMDVFAVLQKNCSLIFGFLENHPWGIIFALLLAPSFGVPTSLLWILSGALWGIKTGMFICFICLGVNLIFSYFFYKNCVNKFLSRCFFKDKFPSLACNANNANASRLVSIKWVFLLQLIPHMPYIAQCYILATLKEVNFWHYLSISWFAQSLWAFGFICLGYTLKAGQWGITLFAIIFMAIYLTRKGYHYFKKLDKKQC